MVLEAIISPRTAEKTPWKMFIIGVIYSSLALLLSLWVFESYASLVMVFLTVLACTFLIQSVLTLEEKKDTEITGEYNLLKEHSKALSLFVFLFLGFVVAFSVWYVALPSSKLHTAFATQINTIAEVNKATSAFYFIGSSQDELEEQTEKQISQDQLYKQQSNNKQDSTNNLSGAAIDKAGMLNKIFFNNLKVLFFCILFALFYGAGAVFILAWNASVIGVAIGNFVRTSISTVSSNLGFINMSHYFTSFSLGMATYLTHGIFEIIAYFTAALATGIVSIAIINHEYKSKKFMNILTDGLDLFIISIALLFFAAIVEVYVTPALF